MSSKKKAGFKRFKTIRFEPFKEKDGVMQIVFMLKKKFGDSTIVIISVRINLC